MSEKAFAVYALATKLFQGDLIQVPMNNFTHDLDAIFEAITPNTRLITIVNPNNPTGTAVDPNLLIDFIKSVPRDVIVILDEAYYRHVKELRGDSISLIRNGVKI